MSFYYPFSFINNKKDIIFTLKTLYASLLFILAYGYIQIYSLFATDSIIFQIYMYFQKILNYGWIEMTNNYNLVPQIHMINRIILTNQEPSIAAYVLQTLFYPFLLSSILVSVNIIKNKKRIFELILFILSIPVLIFTFSSAGFVVLLFQLLLVIIMLLYFTKKDIKRYSYFFLLFIFVSLILAIFIMRHDTLYLNTRTAIDKIFISGPGEGSAETRYGTIIAGLKEFLHFPLLGVGLGNSKYFFNQFIPDWALNSEVLSYITTKHALTPRSMWIRLLAETGIIGIFPFLFFIFTIIKNYLSLIKKSNRNKYNEFLFCSFFIFLLAFFIHGFNVPSFFIVFQWTLLGFFAVSYEIR